MNWHQDHNRPPFRPLTNEERRSMWAARYYLRFKPYQHPQKPPEKKDA